MIPSQAANRLDSLQIGRFLAAASVVILHVNAGLSASHHFGGRVPMVFDWGKIGVDYFFVLSGFIITLTLKRERTPADFAWHRAVRIYPAFWLAYVPGLVVAVLVARHLTTPVSTDPLTLLLGALLLPQDGVAPVVGVAWSLHHELLFYALATVWIWRRSLACLAGGLLLIGSALPVHGYPWDFLFSSLHWEFVFGIAAAASFQRLSVRTARTLVVLASAAIAVAIVAWARIPDETSVHVVVFGGPFAVLVASLARLESAAAIRLPDGGRHLARLGDSSYTLYLWHVLFAAPLVKVAFSLNPTGSTAYGVACGAAITVFCVAASHFIYLLVERPLTRAFQRLGAPPSRKLHAAP